MTTTSSRAPALLALAERNAAVNPDRIAVAGPDACYTWAELMALAGETARLIESHGLLPGERVCLRLPSGPRWVATLLAARSLGLTVVSIGDRAKSAEVKSLAARFGARLVLSEGEGALRIEARPSTPRLGSGPAAALIHLTSGSSGVPKGVLRTEADLADEAHNVASALRLTPDDAVLCATSVFHSFASGLLLACMHAGAACLLMDRLAPATLLDLAARQRATIIAGVPYVFQTLTALSTSAALPSLRLAVSGGAPLHPETASRFRQRFGAPLIQEYGLSEAGIVTLNLDGPASSVGAPIPNVELCIAASDDPARQLPAGLVGEVIVRRANPAAGYLDDPAGTAETFTAHGVRTGDLGRLDENGRLTLTGRIKSMINVAGAKVAPREVEEALLAHPGVTEAAVFSIPDPARGEAVGAVVVADATVGETALREHCRALLSAHKVPAVIQVEPALPRTASGKLDLPHIRDLLLSRRLP